MPKFLMTDMLNTGSTFKGKAIITKKFFFIFPDKINNALGFAEKPVYDKSWFETYFTEPENLNTGEFELEILSKMPPEYCIRLENIDLFKIRIGFSIFGGLKLRLKGERAKNCNIGNAAMRKRIKEFYENI